MKIKNLALLLILLSIVSLLIGCTPKQAEIKPDINNHSIRQQNSDNNTTGIAIEPEQTPSAVYTAKITTEEAESIALNHAGFTKEEVTRLRTEFDFDDYVPHYDIEFHQDLWEYEYEINAETGAIISCEKDR